MSVSHSSETDNEGGNWNEIWIGQTAPPLSPIGKIALADSKIEDMAMLYHVCSERGIMLSPAMTDYYRELNANLVLEEGLQDSRRWTDKGVSRHKDRKIVLFIARLTI